MTGTKSWEALIDSRVTLAQQCHASDSPDSFKDLLSSPAFEAARNCRDGSFENQNGDSSDTKMEICEIHRDKVHESRKAYDVFHIMVDALKTEKPLNDEAWEDKIGKAGDNTKAVLTRGLETMAEEAKVVIRGLPDEEERLDTARYLCHRANGYVQFNRKVNKELDLVYGSRKGGQQRVWTALETAGRIIPEAEVVALNCVTGQEYSSKSGILFL